MRRQLVSPASGSTTTRSIRTIRSWWPRCSGSAGSHAPTLGCCRSGLTPLTGSRKRSRAWPQRPARRVCIAAVFAPIDRRRILAELDRCAETLGRAGARVALEFAAYGGLTRLADAVALCEEVGWDRCGVLVDTWHFFRTDAPWEVLRSLGGEQIALVHVNDGACRRCGRSRPRGPVRPAAARRGRVPARRVRGRARRGRLHGAAQHRGAQRGCAQQRSR